jgi:hypothetical protein
MLYEYEHYIAKVTCVLVRFSYKYKMKYVPKSSAMMGLYLDRFYISAVDTNERSASLTGLFTFDAIISCIRGFCDTIARVDAVTLTFCHCWELGYRPFSSNQSFRGLSRISEFHSVGRQMVGHMSPGNNGISFGSHDCCRCVCVH